MILNYGSCSGSGSFLSIKDSQNIQTGFRIRIDLMRIRIRIRIQNFSNCGSGFRIRIPDPDPGFDDLKLKKNYSWNKEIIFFGSKNTIYLSLGLHEGRPSYRRSLQHSKKNIQHFKTWKFCTFSIFVGYFCPPGSGSGSAIWMRIRIQQLKLMRIHADPDPKPCLQLAA